MPRTLIVSASDGGYYSLLDGMLRSIEAGARADGMEIGLLDLGFDDNQRAALAGRGIHLHRPDWDYDITAFRIAPEPFFKAMTARPNLPRHFPGYDMYVWLDADLWVQDWQAVRDYVAAAQRTGFCATAECDRSYTPFYASDTVAAWRGQCFRKCFSEEIARKFAEFPIVNCGAFAARADSPLWQAWSGLLGKVFASVREPYFFAEQTVLNALIRNNSIPTALLPARYNWMCNRALPVCGEDGGLLYDPQPPFEPLGLIHLTANTKHGDWTLADRAGGSHTRSLRFGGVSGKP